MLPTQFIFKIWVIASSSGIEGEIGGAIEEIWTVLLKHAKSEEESTRNIVAEIIGQLCRADPGKFLPEVLKISKKGNSMERSTAATAFRFVLLSSNQVAEQILHENLGDMLAGISDEDLSVRRTTIMTLNSAAHNKPRYVKELLPQLLPALFNETVVNQSLIREVEMVRIRGRYNVFSSLPL